MDVFTDAVGPQPPGTIWDLRLFDTSTEELITRRTTAFSSNAQGMLLLNGSDEDLRVVVGSTIAISGRNAYLQVQLVQPDTTVIEDESVGVILDMLTGIPAELQEYLRTHLVGGAGGLTTEEHDALIITQAAVTADIGPGIGDLIQSIGSLITKPTLAIGSLSSPAYELEGDGEIPDIGDVLHSKFGLYWLATTIPPGLGHLHGNTEEYLQRLVQFRTLHVVGGVELVTEVFDANWHGGLWSWSVPKPTAIEYSILPGVHLQVRWWQFP